MRPVPLLALLLGCPSAEEPVASEAPYTPVPYVYEESAPPSPDLALSDIEAAIDAAIEVVPTLGAGPVFPAYFVATRGADAGCPAYYESEGNVYWYDQCTSDSGTSFSGYSFYVSYDGYDDGSGYPYEGNAIYGVAEVATPEGYTFVAGGSATALIQPTDSYTVYYSSIHGGFSWDGPGSDGTWLAEGVAPDLDMYAYATLYGNLVQVDGGIASVGGLDAVVFDTVLIFADALGSTCGVEPGGAMSVRDGQGYWYDVLFDGPPSWEDNDVDPALCDGCGTAYFQGEAIGPVCSDFTRLIDFTEAPW